MRRVRESLLLWKRDKFTYLCVCACVRDRARGRVHAALLMQHATGMRHIVTSLVASRSPPYFSKLYHKRRDF